MLPGMRRLKTAMTALLGVGFLASAARSEADAAAKQVPLGTPTRTARGRGDEPTELPDDPELPALTVIREQGVVTAVPFLGLGSGPVELRVRGYTQGSRATLEARNEDLHLAIKVYAKDAEPEARLYEALAAAGLAGNSGARVPRLLAWDRDLRLLVIDWLDGATLDQLVCRGQGARAGELAADWLHRMASLPVMPGQPVAATGVLQQVAQWVDHLCALDPALGLVATAVPVLIRLRGAPGQARYLDDGASAPRARRQGLHRFRAERPWHHHRRALFATTGARRLGVVPARVARGQRTAGPEAVQPEDIACEVREAG